MHRSGPRLVSHGVRIHLLCVTCRGSGGQSTANSAQPSRVLRLTSGPSETDSSLGCGLGLARVSGDSHHVLMITSGGFPAWKPLRTAYTGIPAVGNARYGWALSRAPARPAGE